jgi:4-amino-4-deoxy-L-arabinose transferase-like glycosyltransferase
MTIAHTYRVRPGEDHFQFGWEAGRIARALVTGYGYADPFSNSWMPHTGATAWLPPLYPLLLAGIFRVFGIYTQSSAWVLFAIQSAFSAATALAVWEIAIRCFSRRVALWSAWLWALYPAAMQYSVRWPWEMTITTALFTYVIALAIRMRGIGAKEPIGSGALTTAWLLFGVLWGVIALSNATLLLFLPVCGAWILAGTFRKHNAVRDAVLSGVVFLACIAPWTARNYVDFHRFIPLRGNFGAELYMGNGPGSTGFLMEHFHPFQDRVQLHRYAELGEVGYVAERGAAANAFIAAHPGHFIANVTRRVWFFWAGVPSDQARYKEAVRTLNYGFLSVAGLLGLALALRNRVPAAGLFAWAFVLLPMPYYIVTVHARFRHPLEPLIAILGVYLFQSAERGPASSAGSAARLSRRKRPIP